MADEQLNKLIDKQNTIWKRMETILAEAGDDWTGEQRANYDAAEKDLTEVSSDIDRVNRSAKLAKVDYSQVVDAGTEDRGADGGEKRDGETAYGDAFDAYMRQSVGEFTREQRQVLQRGFQESRAAGAATGSAGGYTVPQGFLQQMTVAMKAYGGILELCDQITTETGNPLPWATMDDTGNVGAILGENTQIGEQDVVFGQASLGAYTYTSKLVRVSWQLLQDSAFDVNTWLAPRLGERIGRIWATHLISGTGSGQPLGAISGGTVGVTAATGGTTAITFDNLIDLEHSVDPAYRNSPRVRYLLSDGALKTLRKLKDNNGQYLWQPAPSVGTFPSINGHAYTIDNSMAVPGANNKTVAFGDFYAGMIVRIVRDVTVVRLSERFADFLQDGVFSFARMDARPNDTNAYKVFQHSAT